MWTDPQLSLLRRSLALGVLLSACALGTGARPASGTPAAAEPSTRAGTTPGPFADVPVKHPTYAAGDTLANWGFPFDRSGCYAPRTLTRYEFAVSAQRLQAALRVTVDQLNAGQVPVGGSRISWRTDRWKFIDARRLREALKLQEALVREFAPELQLLEARPDELLSELRGWKVKANALARDARKTPLRDPMIELKGSGDD